MNKQRIILTIALLAVGAFFVNLIVGSFQQERTITTDRVLRKINLVASVNAIDVDPSWSQDGSRTAGGNIRLALDDLRTVTIFDQTLVDDYTTVPACSNFTTANACVLLADMLGDAVIWFALVPADTASGQEYLTLPGLIDMRANGDEGILRNGWVLNLTTGVRRECGETDTASLRDFITRFPDIASTSRVNLTTDNIVAVSCVQ